MEYKPLGIEIGKFMVDGLSFALNNSCNIIVIFCNFIYMGMLGDPLLSASFGLGVSYFMFLFMSLNLGCFEVTGIELARQIASKDANKYIKVTAGLWKGILLLCIILCFSVFMFIFATDI